ncbi:MAG: hypothetical protein ACYST0_13245 [Planctomycetota bacterium]
MISIDGKPVRDGKMGPMCTRLTDLFAQFCHRRLRETYRPELEQLLSCS